jgi:hypothetical protein
LKRIRTSKRCNECLFILAIQPGKNDATVEEYDRDDYSNFNSYEDYMVMEKFNNWMQQEHWV